MNESVLELATQLARIQEGYLEIWPRDRRSFDNGSSAYVSDEYVALDFDILKLLAREYLALKGVPEVGGVQ